MERDRTWPLLAAFLFLIGILLRLFLSAYTMLAYGAIGIALVILAFWLVKSRLLRRVFIGLLALGLLTFAVLEGLVLSAALGTGGKASHLIVLGAGVDGTTPSASLRWRLEAALEYLNDHPDTVAIVSGGQGPGEEITEAECMYRWLTARGVSPERVLREDRSTSTEENIAFSLELLPEDSSVAVVTAEYHLYRALTLARRAGIPNPVGVPAETKLPLLRVNYFIREAFALAALFVFG